MRITLQLRANQSLLSLPYSYNYLVQSFIYRSLSLDLADFLHNKGCTIGKRVFKPFCFSRILGRYRVNRNSNNFEFNSPIKIIISSPIEEFIQNLAENLVKKESIRIGRNRLFLQTINVHFERQFSSKITIAVLSPITCYSTLSKADGRKKTYYYSPLEKEFSALLKENLRKKYQILYKHEPKNVSFAITPLSFSKNWEKIVEYKGTVIKGWMGRYILESDPEILSLAYNWGLGSKNAQGFGLWEIEKNNKRHYATFSK